MSEEKWQLLKKKYGTFEGAMGLPPPAMAPIITDQAICSPDFDIETERAKIRKRDERRELEDMMHFERCIRLKVNMCGKSFRTPTPSLQDHAEKSKKFDIQQLKDAVQEYEDAIESNEQMRQIITRAVFGPEIVRAVENWNFPVAITYSQAGGNRTHLVHKTGYEEESALAKEEIAVLGEIIELYKKVLAVYRGELQRKESRAPSIIAEKISEMSEICKEAEKHKKILQKISAKYRKDSALNVEDASRFLESKKAHHDLMLRYMSAQSILRDFAGVQSLKLTPPFPELAIDDIAGTFDIELIAKKSKLQTPKGVRGLEAYPEK